MLVSRNPFARHEIHRRLYAESSHSCTWCGQKKRVHEYWLETDGGREIEFNGVFCSVDCFRCYHETH